MRVRCKKSLAKLDSFDADRSELSIAKPAAAVTSSKFPRNCPTAENLLWWNCGFSDDFLDRENTPAARQLFTDTLAAIHFNTAIVLFLFQHVLNT